MVAKRNTAYSVFLQCLPNVLSHLIFKSSKILILFHFEANSFLAILLVGVLWFVLLFVSSFKSHYSNPCNWDFYNWDLCNSNLRNSRNSNLSTSSFDPCPFEPYNFSPPHSKPIWQLKMISEIGWQLSWCHSAPFVCKPFYRLLSF